MTLSNDDISSGPADPSDEGPADGGADPIGHDGGADGGASGEGPADGGADPGTHVGG
ncbi:BatC protein, partial [Actinoplanes philippinensis]